MSDVKLDPRLTKADPLETALTNLDARQSQLHTAMPGRIVSYDANKMTVVVQPLLQGIRTMKDGTRKAVTIAELHDVPVMFPGGGQHTLTFPINKGDECLLIFAERSIDNWFQHGGTQMPSDWRMHDINDGFAFVGLRSQPGVLGAGGTAPAASADTTTLRSDDGKTVVQIDGKNNAITLYAAGASDAVVFVNGKDEEVIIRAKTIQLQASGHVWITSPAVDINPP